MADIPTHDSQARVETVTFTQLLGSTGADLNVTTSFGVDFFLHHLTAVRTGTGGQDDLTMTRNSGAGAAFDIVIETDTLANGASLFVTFNPPCLFKAGDELDIFFPQQGGANTRQIDIELVVQYV